MSKSLVGYECLSAYCSPSVRVVESSSCPDEAQSWDRSLTDRRVARLSSETKGQFQEAAGKQGRRMHKDSTSSKKV